MKIIYVTNARIPTEKAHGYQIVKMCESFAAAGATVELWLPNRRNIIQADAFSYYRLKKNFKIRIIAGPDFYRYYHYLGRASFWLQGLGFLASLLAVWPEKNSLIYTREPEIGALFSRRGYKTVYEAHTWPERHAGFYKFLFKKIGKIITITQGLKKFFVQAGYPEENILPAPDGVDLEEFDLDISREAARKKLHLPADKKIALYTGHLYGWKGAQDLAEAADRLQPDCLAVFVGGVASDAEKFKQRNHELINRGKIRLFPHQPHEAMPVWLKAADVLVLPNRSGESISRLFTSPLKLFEYLASGRPIVASDLPSLREILKENNCVFFAADQPADLAEKINFILTNPDLANKISVQARADVENYTWSRRAEKIMDFLA